MQNDDNVIPSYLDDMSMVEEGLNYTHNNLNRTITRNLRIPDLAYLNERACINYTFYLFNINEKKK